MAPDADVPRCRLLALLAVLLFPIALHAAAGDDAGAFFGKETASEAALMGLFYDFKQTQQRAPTGVDVATYTAVLDEFVSRGFDEDVLNRYYRTSKPLYTTQVCIPVLLASQAPKAFGVDKIVKPSRWVIHYKAQVSPPEDGVYRFAGYADDALFVAVNGKLVLDGSRKNVTAALKKTVWHASDPYPHDYQAGNGHLNAGDWVPLKAGQPVDLDVIIGEQPGGEFCAFLLYEKQGATYPSSRGHPVLPLFQVAPYGSPLPTVKGVEASIDQVFWKCYQ
jgi:hypothetical protein